MTDPLASLGAEHGWMGFFTRNQVKGAYANGSRVMKIFSDPGDGTPLGTEATVLGSIWAAARPNVVLYFVEWDDKPRVAVAVANHKIGPVP